jgi:hypothetical protein
MEQERRLPQSEAREAIRRSEPGAGAVCDHLFRNRQDPLAENCGEPRFEQEQSVGE